MLERRRQRHTPPDPSGASDVGVDRVAAQLATRQRGVVGRAQLVALGVTPHAIDHRVRTGRFIAVFRGVYAVGHAALGDTGRLQAALIAAGPGATLSHRTAGAVHQLTAAVRRGHGHDRASPLTPGPPDPRHAPPLPGRDRRRPPGDYLVARGYVVLRFTWRQIVDEPILVATRVARALALRAAAG